MIEKIAKFQCTRCKKEFFNNPGVCSCETSLEPGKTVGVFLLLNRVDTRRWRVTCLLCGIDTIVDYTNIRKQHSCGCKPRAIAIQKMDGKSIKYFCSRCHKTTTATLPCLEWCCQE